MLSKGYVHVYTGNGKGKTTAAIGLAIRAAGAGIKVFIGQFLKGRYSSEHEILKKFIPLIDVEMFGREGFIFKDIEKEDRENALNGVLKIKEVMDSGEYGLVIMDEINVALYYGLVDLGIIIDLIKGKPDGVELVLTGRNAHPSVIEIADLVTEMKEIKHYLHKGIKARRGIEK